MLFVCRLPRRKTLWGARPLKSVWSETLKLFLFFLYCLISRHEAPNLSKTHHLAEPRSLYKTSLSISRSQGVHVGPRLPRTREKYFWLLSHKNTTTVYEVCLENNEHFEILRAWRLRLSNFFIVMLVYMSLEYSKNSSCDSH